MQRGNANPVPQNSADRLVRSPQVDSFRPLATGFFALKSMAIQIEAEASGSRPWNMTADFRQTMPLGTRVHASIIWRSKLAEKSLRA